MFSFSTLFLFGLTIVSFLFMVGIIVKILRPKRVDPRSSLGLAEDLAPRLTSVASGLVNNTKRLLGSVYLFLLLLVWRAVSLTKFYLQRLEKRFSFLIETVRGRRYKSLSSNQRGAVSFFLEQIKLDQEQALRRTDRR